MYLLNIADSRGNTTQKGMGSVHDSNAGIKAMTWKAEALVLLVGLCREMSSDNAGHMLSLVACIAAARPDNAQELADKGAVKVLLFLLVHGPDDAAMHMKIVEIIVSIGSVYLDPTDGRRILKLCSYPTSPWRALLLPVIEQISEKGERVSASYARFSMEVHGYASAEVHVHKEIAWPPSAGYSAAFWLCVEKFGQGPIHLMHLYAQTRNSKGSHRTSIMLNKYAAGQLSIHIGDSDELSFTSFKLTPNTWYHIALVHVSKKMTTSEAFLFVNGRLRQEGKLKLGGNKMDQMMGLIASSPTTDLTIFLGLPNNVEPQSPSEMQWKMRGVVIVEEPLAADTVLAMCRWGYSYDGCYQCEPYEGDIASSVLTAWRYAAVDSCECEDAPVDVNRAAAKIPWDKLMFASQFLDRTACQQVALGVGAGALQSTYGRGGVQNLKQPAPSGKLAWLPCCASELNLSMLLI
jgi:hypothetical protein